MVGEVGKVAAVASDSLEANVLQVAQTSLVFVRPRWRTTGRCDEMESEDGESLDGDRDKPPTYRTVSRLDRSACSGVPGGHGTLSSHGLPIPHMQIPESGVRFLLRISMHEDFREISMRQGFCIS